MKKLFYIAASVLLMAGCRKTDLADSNATGEGLVGFTLTNPTSGTAVVLNAAVPTSVISFSWKASKPGLTTVPTYKVVAAQKTGGDLETPLLQFDAGNAGKDTTLQLTYKQLDDALKAAGVADGALTELIWSVQADNGSVKILAQNIFNLTVTRFKDGASPFILLGPQPTGAPLEINPTSTSDEFTFNWTKSEAAAGGPAVKYTVLFTNNNSFATPLFTMTPGNNGVDTFIKVSYKQISDSLAQHGYADIGLQADLKWTVVATSGTWKQQADYTNQLSLLRQVKFYIVGSLQSPQWDINNPLELITDKKSDRYGKVFYTYVKLNAGDEFKFFKTKGDWGSGYGNNGASGDGYATGFNVGGNFQIATSGIYRLTLDVENNMAYIQQKQVGIVGGMQGWSPGTPLYGAYIQRDKFLIVVSANGDQFKFHDGSAGNPWTFGIKDDRWWGDAGDNKLNYDGGDPNLVADAPRTRLIWDGTNSQQLKYEKIAAAEMRLVGDGINQAGVNDWDPPSSPQMTYSGNGVWTITIDLKANKDIKFLAGNAWGAFDYEDNSGQSQALGTSRPIRWDGDKNFKTPTTAGTYTITLNEHTQSVTIN